MKTAKQLFSKPISTAPQWKRRQHCSQKKARSNCPISQILVFDPLYEGPKNIRKVTHLPAREDVSELQVRRCEDLHRYAGPGLPANYTIHQRSGISGKLVHQRFFGHCTAADGKVVLLREALNVLAAADGMFPNGIADIVNKK